LERPSLPPSGISGWLIIPVLLTFGSALYLCATVCAILAVVLLYNKQFWPLADGMFVILAIGWIVACLFLVKKMRWYPKLFVALSGVMFVYCIVVFYWIFNDQNSVFPDAFDQTETPYLLNAILIPYMLFSKRVKNTFVN
jgi:hypothetical protein